jgi:hypothetical protein
MSSNKKRDMETSDDDNEYDEDYEDKGGRSHDALLRKIGMLCQRCIEYKIIIKRLKMELRLLKSHASKMSDKELLQLGWQGG